MIGITPSQSARNTLMAADHALRRELSRRVRDDLIRLGIVRPGPEVRIVGGATASPGDLIVCTRNDRSVQAGEAGRTLANGDLLRIDVVTGDGLLVRRALDADPATGQHRWTGQPFRYADYGEAACTGLCTRPHSVSRPLQCLFTPLVRWGSGAADPAQ